MVLFNGKLSSQNLTNDYKKFLSSFNSDTPVNSETFKLFESKHLDSLQKNATIASEFYYYYGNSLCKERRNDDAIGVLSKSYQLAASSADSLASYFPIYTLARITQGLSMFQKSDEYYTYALPGLAKFYGPSSKEYTECYFHYVKLLIDMERYSEASPLLDAILYYYETLNLKDDETYLAALSNKAYLMHETGNYNESEKINLLLLRDNKLLESGDTLAHIIVQTNLGESYRERGDYFLVDSLLNLAEKNCVKYRGAEADQLASINNNLGLLYKTLGKWEQSYEKFNKSIGIYEENKLDTTEAYCTALSNYSDMLRLFGRLDEAKKVIEKSIATRSKYYGYMSENFANAKSNAGLIGMEMQDTLYAFDCFQKALEIYKNTVNPQHQSLANCYNNLSSIYTLRNNLEIAADYKNKAIAIIKETLGEEHYKYLSFKLGLNDIYINQNKINEAKSNLESIIPIIEKQFDKKHELYHRAISNYGLVLLLLKDFKQSLVFFNEGISSKIQGIDEFFYEMSKSDQRLFIKELEQMMSDYRMALFNIYRYNPDLVSEEMLSEYLTFQFKLKSVLSKSNSIWQIKVKSSNNLELKKQYDNYLISKTRLNNLLRSESSSVEINELKEKVDKLETNLKKNLGGKSEEKLSVKDFVKSLPLNSTYIDVSEFDAMTNEGKYNSEYVGIFVNNKDYKVELHYLNPEGSDLEEIFESYYNGIDSLKKDTIAYRRLFNGSLDKIEIGSNLFVSADGIYHKISFESVYNPYKNNYLIDNFNIHNIIKPGEVYESNGDNNEKSIVLIGNPKFDLFNAPKQEQLLASTRFDLEGIGELPGTEEEINEIATKFKSGNWKVKLFNKEDAKEESLYKIKNPAILHIATHGFFLDELELGGEKVFGYSNQVFNSQPDLRTGLLLSGAVQGARGDYKGNSQSDGILTAREVTDLNLVNTELLVLSACQTGLVNEKSKSELIGLPQAFASAGAKRMLLSLWPVDDKATKQFMLYFYEEWLKAGTDYKLIPSAIKKAKIELRKKYPEPYFWAAFTLIEN
ncbi:MAG: CHAT domain-containing protein [Bacteroidia bacterium]